MRTTTKRFIWAADKGHLETVQLLLDNGAYIHTHNDEALQSAALKGHTDIIHLLLDNGADIHADNDRALLRVVKSGRIATIQLLLDNGADINANNGESLLWAVKRGLSDIVRLLLDNGADIYVNDALLAAKKTKHTEIVKMLTEHKSKLISKTPDLGKTHQCAAITLSGARCKFKAKEGLLYCGRHQK